MRMDHVHAELLSAYLDGQVSPEERARLEGHLTQCPACRRRLRDLEWTAAAVRGLEAPEPPPGLAQAVRARLAADRRVWHQVSHRVAGLWPPSWRTAGAAAAVVLVGIFSLNLWQQVAPQPAVRAIMPTREVAVPPSTEGAPAVPGSPRLQPVVPELVTRDRQVIRSAIVTLRVDEFDRAAAALVRLVEEAGGFVASSSTTRARPQSGVFVLRVPEARFAEVLAQVEALGEVEARQVRGQDVTEEFIDLRARVRNLERHEQQLVGFMGRATEVADLLAIERELARVRGEIEVLTGRLRFIGDRVALATVEVTLQERPGGAPAFWDFTATVEKLRAAFLGTIRTLLAAAERLMVLLSALVPLGLLAAAAWGLVRWVGRRRATPA